MHAQIPHSAPTQTHFAIRSHYHKCVATGGGGPLGTYAMDEHRCSRISHRRSQGARSYLPRTLQNVSHLPHLVYGGREVPHRRSCNRQEYNHPWGETLAEDHSVCWKQKSPGRFSRRNRTPQLPNSPGPRDFLQTIPGFVFPQIRPAHQCPAFESLQTPRYPFPPTTIKPGGSRLHHLGVRVDDGVQPRPFTRVPSAYRPFPGTLAIRVASLFQRPFPPPRFPLKVSSPYIPWSLTPSWTTYLRQI